MSAVAAWAVRHARAVLAVTALLAVVAAVAATQLPTDAATSTLVDSNSATYRATQEVRQEFGEEPVVVLAEGDLQQLVLTSNLGRLLRLEGCLSGNPPEGVKPIPGPCTELAALHPVRSVVGPATFLNEAVIQIDRQLQRLIATTPPAKVREIVLSLAARYGITGVPSLANPNFLAAIVFDLRRHRDTPKARLAYLFPNGHSAQVIVRLRPDLSEAERHRAIELIRAAVEDRTPRAACKFKGRPEACFALHGGRFVISGAPVVVDAVTRALKDALLLLFAVAVVVMAIVLLLVFRSRFRLLPLLLALAAAALDFGLLHLFGGSLTMASIAVLPVLIGLAVDYAIQLQSRFDEEVEAAAPLVLGGAEPLDRSANLRLAEHATRKAVSRAGPTIATACLATAAGFLVLLLSPTPMVRGFALMMVAGIAIAFLLALTAGFAALGLRTRAGGGGVSPLAGFFASRAASLAKGSVRKTGRRCGGRHPLLLPRRAVDLALAHPQRVLGVGVVFAVIGWGLGTQVETQSSIVTLAPQNVGAVKDLKELQDATGVSGELDVRVKAPDLTDPATIRWMAAFKRRALEAGGFSGSDASCREAEICPGPALSDFVTGGGALPGGESERFTKGEIEAALRQIPRYDLRQVANIDPGTGLPAGTALISFGIRAQSLEKQQALIERVQDAAGTPPPGVEVEPVGLPVMAAQAASDLSSNRYLLTLAGLAAVALVLLAVYRSIGRALVPLVPVLLAAGWGSLVLWATRIPLNPMSAALGALTVAIATEFSVILAGRFHEERRGGREVAEALRAAYARTGAAVLASGLTAIAGFAVLIASDVGMLRDFGIVTVIDLAVALAGVMVALPAALALAAEGRTALGRAVGEEPA